MTAGLVSLTVLSTGCASVNAPPKTRPQTSAPNGGSFLTARDQPKLQACYADAKLRDPSLSVHTVALFFARDGRFVFVDVELPETPALARCLSNEILGSPYQGPVTQGSGVVASGGLRIDLGPPLTDAERQPRPTLAEMRARHRRVTLAALQQGVLRESDPILRELRNPPPPWPTLEMRVELDACHEDALKSQPGLEVHRDVIYLTRGGKVLLADVSIPEAPELQRCVLERIRQWPSPSFEPSDGTVLSGFFIDLGGPEQLPEKPATLSAELERRSALVLRALELGMIAADDPVLQRFKSNGATPGHAARPGEPSGAR